MSTTNFTAHVGRITVHPFLQLLRPLYQYGTATTASCSPGMISTLAYPMEMEIYFDNFVQPDQVEDYTEFLVTQASALLSKKGTSVGCAVQVRCSHCSVILYSFEYCTT